MTHKTDATPMFVFGRTEKLAMFSFVMAGLFFSFTLYLGVGWSHVIVLQALATPLAVAAVYSIVAFWRGRLVRREEDEALDQDRVRREYDRSDLFGDRDEALSVEAGARKGFDRYVIPVFTVLFGLALGGLVLVVWHAWDTTLEIAGGERNPLGASGLSFFLSVFCLLMGSYFNGVSRERGCRFLRPMGQWFLFTAAAFLLAVAVLLAEHFHKAVWDVQAGKLILLAVAVLALEIVINVVMEFYRPRTAADEPRPLFESRLLALVTEPGGIARNVAHSLDYQFGFQVSETWFYQFLERAVIPFCLLLVVTLYLLDCVVFVDAGERGVRERFGTPIAELGAGLHFKAPAPFERIRKMRVQAIRKVNIGFVEEGDEADKDPAAAPPEMPEEMQGDPTGKIVVWGKTHYKKETKFIVATQEQRQTAAEEGAHAVPDADVPVNFITCSVSVFYRIEPGRFQAYLYNYADPDAVLQQISSRELVAFLASEDLLRLLGEYRDQAKDDLGARIRQAVAKLDPPLGVDVQFVAFMGIHPPVEAADAYEQVVSAREERETKRLTAKKEAVKRINESRGTAKKLVTDAEAYQLSVTRIAEAEAFRFQRQMAAFAEAPAVYKERLFLDMLERHSESVRKYVVATRDPREVLILDLQEKMRPDMIQDLDLAAPEF